LGKKRRGVPLMQTAWETENREEVRPKKGGRAKTTTANNFGRRKLSKTKNTTYGKIKKKK